MTIAQPPAAEDEPKGLGGWLILVIAILVISPAFGLLELSKYEFVVRNFAYLSGQQMVLVAVELADLLLLDVLAAPIILYLMVKRLDLFPGVFIIWLVASVAVIFIYIVFSYLLFSDSLVAQGLEFLAPPSGGELSRRSPMR
ncbi:DUF2569 family protein [Aminobacter sp. UC22_36]|uniref:DUF2569 family protein n=1 Tax=Aminobacter sp. UC22_36 TaxID=3374549 RepID=UPI0037581D57